MGLGDVDLGEAQAPSEPEEIPQKADKMDDI